MVFPHTIAYRTTEITQKAVAYFLAFHNPAGQYGQIFAQVISPEFFEFFRELSSPIHHAHFPAIGPNVFDAVPGGLSGIQDRSDHIFRKNLEGLPAKMVHGKTAPSGTGGGGFRAFTGPPVAD